MSNYLSTHLHDMKVNFRYQKKKNTKKGVIRLDFSYGTNRLRYVFGLSTEEKLWSKAKQRFKSSASNSLELNQRLSFIAKETISIYYELINSNISPSNEMLKEKNVIIELDAMAVQWIADKGFDPSMGARPMQRIFDQSIKRPLSKEILFGKLINGGTALVKAVNDKLEIEYQQ